LVWGWKKTWAGSFLKGSKALFPGKTVFPLFGTAFGMIWPWGIITGLDVNPDEWNGHVKAALTI